MARIDAFGMPSAELLESIKVLAGAGDRDITVTTDNKDTLEDLTSYANSSDSYMEVHDIDHGWEVHLGIGEVSTTPIPHSDKSSVPEDAV